MQEPAPRLEVKDDAVGRRIQRAIVKQDRGPDEQVSVYLNPSSTATRASRNNGTSWDGTRNASEDGLQEQVERLRPVLEEEHDAGRKADAIITHLTRAIAARVPELEAPQASQSTLERKAECVLSGSGTGGPQKAAERPFMEVELARGGGGGGSSSV